MANSFDITSANCTLFLTVEEIYPGGIELQRFSTDQAFSQGETQIAETRMGVDGGMSAGFTPNIKAVTVMLEPNSDSYDALAKLYKAMETNRKIYSCTLVARAPALGIEWSWSEGTLQTGTIVPSAQRVFAPTTWVFHFQTLDTSTF